MALAVASAMSYLHGRQIMHRDLKSQNVLIGELGELQVADFGLAQFAPREKALLTAETGSYRWMAPEVLRHEPYDEKCDVYSFAMLCWEMLTYRVPFEQHQPVQAAFAMAIENKRPDIPASCHPDVKQLLERSWREQSEARPSFAQVCDELQSLQNALRSRGAAADGGASSPSAADCAESGSSGAPTLSAQANREGSSHAGNGSKRRSRPSDPPAGHMKRPKSYNTQLSELRMG